MRCVPLTVACVLRSGGDYAAEHVLALQAAARKFWPAHEPFRFVALTDVDIPGVECRPLRSKWQGWWTKMELFAAAQDDLGDILYFDLDTMIVGALDDVVAVEDLTLLADFYKPRLLQSGMMMLPAAYRPAAWAAWLEGPRVIMAAYRGDGEFLHAVWIGVAATWQSVLPAQVCSYKVHCRRSDSVPVGARVVCFHGQPRPWDSPLWSRAA